MRAPALRTAPLPATAPGTTLLTMRLAALLLCVAFLVLSPAQAQVVRGVARERNNGQPLAGVLVSLEGEGRPLASAGSVLTGEQGEYRILAPGPGRYRITAKRIGVQRHVSELFELVSGETKVLDIVLDAVVYRLPAVTVESDPICVLSEPARGRVLALWDEVRTALTATQISLRDRLFRGSLSRYVRELDPRNLRVLSETRSRTQGVMYRPFVAAHPETLSAYGYWRRLPDGSMLFNAPDSDVLLSNAFRRDHCFAVREGTGSRRGLTGLVFQPTAERTVPEMRGTIWLDGRTFELRLVEFGYTQLEEAAGVEKVGGEVHFSRLPSGAWIVTRWFIRMPQYARNYSAPVGVSGPVPSVLVRPSLWRLLEEGGVVSADGLRSLERPASLLGSAQDSLGRPLQGVVVRLAGTPYTATTAADGTFHMDSLAAGSFSVLAEDSLHLALGTWLDQETVELHEGETARVVLRAPSAAGLAQRLCGKVLEKGRALLRIWLVQGANTDPAVGVRLILRWTAYGGSAQEWSARALALEAETDSKGGATFCGVPSGLRLELVRGDDGERILAAFQLAEGQLAARRILLPEREP
jgi:hypothetical protein